MRTLSSTLLAAQKSPSSIPYVKVEIRNNIGVATRLDWQKLYSGSEPLYHHAATIPDDGSLVRARIAFVDPDYILYRQRVTNPSPGSNFSSWSQIATVSSLAGTALTSHEAKVIHFWVDPDQVTIRYQESTDYGATWGEIQTLLTESSPIYHLAAAMKPNGDVCLFYTLSSELRSVKRTSGVWGSPQSWSNNLQSVSGISTVYNGDWNLVICGADSEGKKGVWSAIYGDGAYFPSGNRSSLKEIMVAYQDSQIEYHSPSLALEWYLYRLFFLEKYVGEQSYSRPYFSHSPPNSPFPDNLWREPVPFNLVTEYCPVIAIPQVANAAYAWLSLANAVWRARLNPTVLDVTADVISLHQFISNGERLGRLEVELRNDHRKYANFNQKGSEISVRLGYQTTAGEETSPGPSFWIESWEYISQPSQSTIRIHGIDTWGWLQKWTCRRQITWVSGSATINEILKFFIARSSLLLSIKSKSNALATQKPSFTIHPGQSGTSAVKRLLAMVPDVIFFQQAQVVVKNPQNSDPIDYTYGTDHPIYEGRYHQHAWDINRAQVYGKDIMVESFNWGEVEDTYDRLHQIHDLNITTVAQAEERANTIMRRSQREATSGEILVPVNCGQELWDVVEVNDPRVNWLSQRWRVVGLEIHYLPKAGQYYQKLHLGAL